MVQVGRVAALAVKHHGSEMITVTRRTGSYSGGVWSVDSSSTIAVKASASRAKGLELERLPEGQRNQSVLRLLTLTEILAADGESGQMADVLAYDGDNWEVRSVTDWNGFWDVLAVRLEGAP